MPYIDITLQGDIDIDIYCNECRFDLSSLTKVDNRRREFYVGVCPNCMKEKEKEIEELKRVIEELESKKE